jgi:hypothetical protein
MSSPSQSTPVNAESAELRTLKAELNTLKKTLLFPHMQKLLVHFKGLFATKESIREMKTYFSLIAWNSQAEQEAKAVQINFADLQVVNGLKLTYAQFREMAVIILGEDVVNAHLPTNAQETYSLQNMETVLNLVDEVCKKYLMNIGN